MTGADRHPCFNAAARSECARIHLPVAPDCNISCAYCDGKTDCVNESWPGVCSRVLEPEEAAELVDGAVLRMPALAVAGIAGPGDPLANPEPTLHTFELIRRRHPGLLFCLSTNGVVLAGYAADLKSLGVGHVTVTVNAFSVSTAARIYRRLRINDSVIEGREAAERILEGQKKALAALRQYGIATKVNTVVVPGVNDGEVEAIAEMAAGYGVSLMNCISFIPLPGTALEMAFPPDTELMESLRVRAGMHVPQMRHCARCRADAFGLLRRTRDIRCSLTVRSPRQDRVSWLSLAQYSGSADIQNKMKTETIVKPSGRVSIGVHEICAFKNPTIRSNSA